jgi:hypothetical protein
MLKIQTPLASLVHSKTNKKRPPFAEDRFAFPNLIYSFGVAGVVGVGAGGKRPSRNLARAGTLAGSVAGNSKSAAFSDFFIGHPSFS